MDDPHHESLLDDLALPQVLDRGGAVTKLAEHGVRLLVRYSCVTQHARWRSAEAPERTDLPHCAKLRMRRAIDGPEPFQVSIVQIFLFAIPAAGLGPDIRLLKSREEFRHRSSPDRRRDLACNVVAPFR